MKLQAISSLRTVKLCIAPEPQCEQQAGYGAIVDERVGDEHHMTGRVGTRGSAGDGEQGTTPLSMTDY